MRTRINYFELLCWLWLICLFPGGCGGVSDRHADRSMSLTVMHLNDTHSHVDSDELSLRFMTADDEIVRLAAGSFTRLATTVGQIRDRAENTLLLHAGDAVQGTLYYILYGGESDVDFLNRLGLDAMTTGNHEFDRDSATYADFIDRAGFPIVTANVDFSTDPFLDGKTVPYIIKEFSGGRVGIIGLVTDDCPNISSPDPAIVFLDPVETARRYLTLLEKKGINKIILLTHLGYEADMALARSLPGIDIVVGGHSHTLLGDFDRLGLSPAGDYPQVVIGNNDEITLVVQAWQWGDVLGRLDVDFDARGRVTGWNGAPVIVTGEPYRDAAGTQLEGDNLDRARRAIAADPLVDAVEEDAGTRALLDYYRQGLLPFQAEVVGRASRDLLHVRVPDKTLPGGSMIAPVVCDAMLWKARRMGITADMAIQNAGGVRTEIHAGDITVADVFALQPFGNTLVVLSLTGIQVKQSLEDALGAVLDGGSTGPFPYVAGIRYWSVAENFFGQRITRVEVGDGDSGWTELDMGATYTVVTNAYLAQGKDGYVTFGLVSLAGAGYDTGFVDAWTFMDYVSAVDVIGPVEQRVFYSESAP